MLPFLLAIDGRSASGKTTTATRIVDAMPASAVVHTDDIAWYHSVFDWDHLVLEHVIGPLRRGEAVDYRPPGWVAHDRPGAVRVPAGLLLVVIEGVGAGRPSLAAAVDAVIWVETSAEVRLARDERRIASGETTRAIYESWMAEEVPFQDGLRTWERADVVIGGGD